MKVLSLTQPWATLVVLGLKRIETRSWATSYRGELGIHAAKGLGPVGGMRGLLELLSTEPFWSVLREAFKVGALYPGDAETIANELPFGAILGQVDLIDCVQTWPSWASVDPWFTGQRQGRQWHVPPPGPERSFGDYTPGRFAWLLDEPRALAEPIPCKGALGLWNYAGELPYVGLS